MSGPSGGSVPPVRPCNTQEANPSGARLNRGEVGLRELLHEVAVLEDRAELGDVQGPGLVHVRGLEEVPQLQQRPAAAPVRSRVFEALQGE